MKRLYPALVVAVFIALTYTFWPRAIPPAHYLEVTMRASAPGLAQLFLDSSSKPSEAAVPGDNQEGVHRFPLPDGRYLNLNLSPTDVAGASFTVSHVKVISRTGTLIRSIAPERVKTLETSELYRKGLGQDRPMLLVEIRPPLVLKSYARPSGRTFLRRFVIAFLIGVLAGFMAIPLFSRLNPILLRPLRQVIAWICARPERVVLITAAASVILSCYPIVFFGKSFLSPNNHSHTLLLYAEMPTVPDSTEAASDNDRGSDLGAAMWYSWPASVAESRALFKDFELPLWNRYDSCGLPLLGQGQSMFGDPLHLLVLMTNGASGWWDLKYLLAKCIFAASLGLCVLQLSKHLPAAVIITASSVFIGFFSYRYSHPAFFSLCYAPFILLCWFKLIDASKNRAALSWLVLMVLANWMAMNSGTVKEAYVLLLAMNFCGFITLILRKDVLDKSAKLRRALLVQFLFLLIATPVWLTFLATLRSSWTVYDAGAVFQLRPGMLIGLFDDILLRHSRSEEFHLTPSLNYLVLAAVMWFSVSRRVDSRESSLGLSITCVLALAFIFELVPASVILQLPFLNRIYHIGNTFSCVAIICLLLLAGVGITAFWRDCESASFKRVYAMVIMAIAGLFLVYFPTSTAAGDVFFWSYAVLLILSIAVLPWLARRLIRNGQTWQALALAAIPVLFHLRHGMHLATPLDTYVMNPQQRTNLLADSSPSLNLIKARSDEPWRSVGLGYNFAPGYGGAVGLEQIDSANPLLNKYYRALMDASSIKMLFGSRHLGVVGENLEADLPLLNMLNVRFLLGSGPATSQLTPSVKRIASLDLDVYESEMAWPRAFFADRLSTYNSEIDFVSLLNQGDGRPFAAIPEEELQKQPGLGPLVRDSSSLPSRHIVAASDYRLTTNTTSFKVRTSGPGVVVLTEPYVQDDFQLQVNGKTADYFRVNSAFRGTYVPAAGDYQFSFSYWPRHFTLSLWFSAAGLALLAIWMGSAWRQSHRAT